MQTNETHKALLLRDPRYTHSSLQLCAEGNHFCKTCEFRLPMRKHIFQRRADQPEFCCSNSPMLVGDPLRQVTTSHVCPMPSNSCLAMLKDFISTLLTSMAVSPNIGSKDPHVTLLMHFEQVLGRLAQGPSRPHSIEKENISHEVALQEVATVPIMTSEQTPGAIGGNAAHLTRGRRRKVKGPPTTILPPLLPEL